jgi:hypothetical protein
MFITYMLQYLDKSTLGNANVLGMAVDTVNQNPILVEWQKLIM